MTVLNNSCIRQCLLYRCHIYTSATTTHTYTSMEGDWSSYGDICMQWSLQTKWDQSAAVDFMFSAIASVPHLLFLYIQTYKCTTLLWYWIYCKFKTTSSGLFQYLQGANKFIHFNGGFLKKKLGVGGVWVSGMVKLMVVDILLWNVSVFFASVLRYFIYLRHYFFVYQQNNSNLKDRGT